MLGFNIENMSISDKISLLQNLKMDIRNNEDIIEQDGISINFIRYLDTLNPQSYGFKIEKAVMNFLKYKRNPSAAGIGDFYDEKNNVNIEFKASINNSDKKQKLNLVQIRVWEKTHFLVLGIVFKNDNIYLFPFYLNNLQMRREINKIGGLSHGSLSLNSNLNYNKKECSIRINISRYDDNFRRWFRLYKTDLFDDLTNNGFIIPKQLNHFVF